MKTFEHEVLDFDLQKKGQHEAMSKALSELGADGFEVVAVVPHGEYNLQITIFLKRQAFASKMEEAA